MEKIHFSSIARSMAKNMADLNHFLYSEQQQIDFGADQEVAAVLGRCLGWYNIVFFPG